MLSVCGAQGVSLRIACTLVGKHVMNSAAVTRLLGNVAVICGGHCGKFTRVTSGSDGCAMSGHVAPVGEHDMRIRRWEQGRGWRVVRWLLSIFSFPNLGFKMCSIAVIAQEWN